MDDKEFKALIKRAIKIKSVWFIAAYLQVSCPTVRRWAEGTSAPHPLMRPGTKKALEEIEIV